jgi:hypothetical protein
LRTLAVDRAVCPLFNKLLARRRQRSAPDSRRRQVVTTAI